MANFRPRQEKNHKSATKDLVSGPPRQGMETPKIAILTPKLTNYSKIDENRKLRKILTPPPIYKEHANNKKCSVLIHSRHERHGGGTLWGVKGVGCARAKSVLRNPFSATMFFRFQLLINALYA
jgi:hypothetical protein